MRGLALALAAAALVLGGAAPAEDAPRAGELPRAEGAPRADASPHVAEAPRAEAAPHGGEGPRVHEVKPGQTLWRIAEITVGDATLWPALYLANRDQIKDPARVYPGQRLAIPEIEPGERAELRREASSLTGRFEGGATP